MHDEISVAASNEFQMPLNVSLVNGTHFRLSNIPQSTARVVCNGEEIQGPLQEVMIIDQSCLVLQIEWSPFHSSPPSFPSVNPLAAEEEEAERISEATTQMNLAFVNKSYVNYTYKPGDTTTGAPLNNGQVCAQLNRFAYLNAYNRYVEQQGQGQSNQTNGTNSSTNDTNGSTNGSMNGTSDPNCTAGEQCGDGMSSAGMLVMGLLGALGVGLLL